MISVFLPVVALVFGVIVSIYLFVEWLRHRRKERFLLLWSVALFLFYWFMVPSILVSFGKIITISDFNLFFALTLPITFFALILIYIGIIRVFQLKFSRIAKIALSIWFVVAVFFFAYHFIKNGGVIETYLLPLGGNIIFYLPIRALIILAFVRWLSKPGTKSVWGILGGIGVVSESVLGLTRNFLVIDTVLSYPPSFWYIAITDLKIFFILQAISIPLLALGFYFLYRMYNQTRNFL